jgi:hypothetical protein
MPVAATPSSNSTIASSVDVSRVVGVGFVIPGSEFDSGGISVSFLDNRLCPNAEMRKDQDARTGAGGRISWKKQVATS